ncbi:MAG: VacJ family lipoprotein [Paracoccaceae bacterium]
MAIRSTPFALLACAILALAGCDLAPVARGEHDPFEARNREIFDNNLRLDRAVSGESPSPQGSGGLRRMVSNFGENLGLPSTILNDLLQLRLDRATENTFRLAVNTTIGIGGLFDPAAILGAHGRRSDFGETLHRWGMGEGAYVVLPLLGPSTERDVLGMVVDTAIDPLRWARPHAIYRWSIPARLAARLADRAEYADLLDANVINTSDPYAQARLLFYQTRRYHLGVQDDEEFIDPYADF